MNAKKSCCCWFFCKVVLDTRRKKTNKKKTGRLAKLYETFIKKKIVSSYHRASDEKPPNPNKCLTFQLTGERPKGHSFEAATEPASLMVYSKQKNCLCH